MSVIAGRVIPSHKHVVIGLTEVYGIGRSSAKKICEKTKIKTTAKVKDLDEESMNRIRAEVAHYIVEGDLRRQVTMNIKRLMDMGCYRGIRHRRGLPMRGQRTRTNAQTRKRRNRSKK